MPLPYGCRTGYFLLFPYRTVALKDSASIGLIRYRRNKFQEIAPIIGSLRKNLPTFDQKRKGYKPPDLSVEREKYFPYSSPSIYRWGN